MVDHPFFREIDSELIEKTFLKAICLVRVHKFEVYSELIEIPHFNSCKCYSLEFRISTNTECDFIVTGLIQKAGFQVVEDADNYSLRVLLDKNLFEFLKIFFKPDHSFEYKQGQGSNYILVPTHQNQMLEGKSDELNIKESDCAENNSNGKLDSLEGKHTEEEIVIEDIEKISNSVKQVIKDNNKIIK